MIFAMLGNNGLGGLGGGNGLIGLVVVLAILGMMNGGNGLFGGNANRIAKDLLGDDSGRHMLSNAIQGNANAISQLASTVGCSTSQIQSAINTVQATLAQVGNQVGMSGQQVINAVQQGNMSLAQQFCKCCCDNQLAIANQTADLQQGIFGAQTTLNDAITRNGFANQMNHGDLRHSIDMMGADDKLAICKQTYELRNGQTEGTQKIIDAIADLKATNIKEFCDIREREMQRKIDSQGDLITQLRGQLDNDRQTAQFNSVLNPLIAKVNEIAAKQPNTIPVQYPNVVAVNATPSYGGCGCNAGCGNNNFFA
jgi:hypothetical protein